MKRKIKLTIPIILLTLALALLGACANFIEPEEITNESFSLAAAGSDLEVIAEQDGSLRVEIGEASFVRLSIFENNEQALEAFEELELELRELYPYRREHFSLDFRHNHRWFITFDDVYAVMYRVRSALVFAYGAVLERAMIDEFMDSIVIR